MNGVKSDVRAQMAGIKSTAVLDIRELGAESIRWLQDQEIRILAEVQQLVKSNQHHYNTSMDRERWQVETVTQAKSGGKDSRENNRQDGRHQPQQPQQQQVPLPKQTKQEALPKASAKRDSDEMSKESESENNDRNPNPSKARKVSPDSKAKKMSPGAKARKVLAEFRARKMSADSMAKEMYKIYNELTVKVLQEKLKELGLPFRGLKSALIERIVKHEQANGAHDIIEEGDTVIDVEPPKKQSDQFAKAEQARKLAQEQENQRREKERAELELARKKEQEEKERRERELKEKQELERREAERKLAEAAAEEERQRQIKRQQDVADDMRRKREQQSEEDQQQQPRSNSPPPAKPAPSSPTMQAPGQTTPAAPQPSSYLDTMKHIIWGPKTPKPNNPTPAVPSSFKHNNSSHVSFINDAANTSRNPPSSGLKPALPGATPPGVKRMPLIPQDILNPQPNRMPEIPVGPNSFADDGSDSEDYPISPKEDSDVEHDEDDEPSPKKEKEPKKWARGPMLKALLERQIKEPHKYDPDLIFPKIRVPDLEQIFGKSKKKPRPRTSSAQWHHDGLTLQEQQKWRREQGLPDLLEEGESQMNSTSFVDKSKSVIGS